MFPVKGVESIEFNKVGEDGVIPTAGWVKLTDIEMGSVSMNIPEKTLTKVKVEDKAGVWAIIGEEGDGASVTAKSLNMEPKAADLLFKGDLESTATTDFDAPTDSTIDINLAIRVTSKARNGFKMVFIIPNASVIARIENALTKDGEAFLALGFTGEALAYTKTDGTPVAPWSYKKVAVA